MKLFSRDVSVKLLAMALVLSVSACASNSKTESDASSSDSRLNSGVSTSGSNDGSVSSQTFSDASAQSGENLQALRKTEFNFGFDSFNVSSSDELALKAHGKYLANSSSARVRVEGHTDERGTREYNLALGEKRAKSVQQVLMSAGAKSSQIEVISYGEETPKSNGTSEAAYSANRRAVLNYTAGRP